MQVGFSQDALVEGSRCQDLYSPFPHGAPKHAHSIILAFYILTTVVWETFQN